ncbi:LysE family translocator [Coralliovum pocilloporae]|uniref:LysE family translocator n=1 Tax=Coralliovum pocilloporae TaxID=3066369 RepID=UPI0033070286
MIPFEVMSLFVIASLALAAAPGPDNIFVLTQSALYGRPAGLAVTAGLCTGLLVHTCLVTIGVAAIFQTSELAFTLLKIAGAGYLLYLAWQAFRAGASDLTDPEAERLSLRKLYLRGIIMNVTNPKVGIFFLAFLPQFADPARGSVGIQMLLLGAIFLLVTFPTFSLVAWCAGFLGNWLKQSTRAQIIMNRVAGLIFVGLATRLMLSER